MVYREVYTEGSETAKSGTDEQERHMRLFSEDKQAHHCNVQTEQSLNSRCRRHWRKEKALPREDLHNHELVKERSAEAIVGTGYELPIKGRGLTKN